MVIPWGEVTGIVSGLFGGGGGGSTTPPVQYTTPAPADNTPLYVLGGGMAFVLFVLVFMLKR